MKKLCYLLLIAGMSLAGQVLQALPVLTNQEQMAFNCVEREVRFVSHRGGPQLCGSLILPKRDHKVPAALIVAGRGLIIE